MEVVVIIGLDVCVFEIVCMSVEDLIFSWVEGILWILCFLRWLVVMGFIHSLIELGIIMWTF